MHSPLASIVERDDIFISVIVVNENSVKQETHWSNPFEVKTFGGNWSENCDVSNVSVEKIYGESEASNTLHPTSPAAVSMATQFFGRSGNSGQDDHDADASLAGRYDAPAQLGGRPDLGDFDGSSVESSGGAPQPSGAEWMADASRRAGRPLRPLGEAAIGFVESELDEGLDESLGLRALKARTEERLLRRVRRETREPISGRLEMADTRSIRSGSSMSDVRRSTASQRRRTMAVVPMTPSASQDAEPKAHSGYSWTSVKMVFVDYSAFFDVLFNIGQY